MFRKCSLLIAGIVLLLAGCSTVTQITDTEFAKVRATPRASEHFYYMGSKEEYDFFVGEQWALHSYPSQAKETEIYYKVSNSPIVKNRMNLTDDRSKWIRLEK